MDSNHTQFINSKVQQLAKLTNEFLQIGSNKQIENKNVIVKQLQLQLLNMSKEDYYFQVIYQFLVNHHSVSEPQLIMTSLLLRDKFRFQFDKYSDEQRITQLQRMLTQIIAKYNNSPHDVFTSYIGICIICLYIKRAHQLYPQYGNQAVLEYFKMYKLEGGTSDYFYKAIEFLPDQILGSRLVMEQNNRNEVRKLVRNSQFQVLKSLNQAAEHLWAQKVVRKDHLFCALQNWIEIGFEEVLFNDLPNHFLVQKLFENCMDSTVSTEASECIKTIIKQLDKLNTNEALFKFLGMGVFTLIDKINTQLKRQDADMLEICESIEVITEFGSAATKYFIQNYNEDVKKFLLSTVNYMKQPFVDCFANIVEFWEYFVGDAQKADKVTQQFVELFNQAYLAVCQRVRFSFDMIKKLNDVSLNNLYKTSSQVEQIQNMREDTESFFVALSLATGQHNYLQFVVHCITQLNRDDYNQFWSFLEVLLHSLEIGLTKMVGYSDDIGKLIASYEQVNNMQEFVAIKNAFMGVFKNFMVLTENNYQIKSQLTIQLFKLIAPSINDPKVSQRAKQAFTKGCQLNPQIVGIYISDFIKLLGQHQGSQQIVEGLMHVLNSNPTLMTQYLPIVLEVMYNNYKQIHEAQKVSNSTKKNVYYSIFRMFKILTVNKNSHEFVSIILEFTKMIWPIVLETLRQPKELIHDEDPEVQRTVKLIKFIMRFLKGNFIPFLESLFNTIIEAYQKYPVCSYTYALEIAITVFYENQSLQSYFEQLYKNFCHITYKHLIETNSVEDYQLLIDDFIGMNKRFFIYNSKIVLNSGELPSIIDTCINLSGLYSVPQPAKSAYQFFQTIFMVYWGQSFIKQFNQNSEKDKFQINHQNIPLYSELKQFILPKLQTLIITLLKHLEKVPLQYIAECIMDCLVAELLAFPKQNADIWSPVLADLNRQILTNQQKNLMHDCLNKVGLNDFQEAKVASKKIEKYIYLINKRYINNDKRRL